MKQQLAGDPVSAISKTDDRTIVWVQFQVTKPSVSRFLGLLDRITASRPGDASVFGVSKDHDHVFVTVACPVGTPSEIVSNQPCAVAAYEMVTALLHQMFDYLPRYVSRPSAAEQAAVATFTSTFASPLHAASNAGRGLIEAAS